MSASTSMPFPMFTSGTLPSEPNFISNRMTPGVCATGEITFQFSAPSQAVGAQKTFTSSADQAAQTIYGYYLTENGSNTLDAAEAFAASASIANNGDNIKVTPTITQA